MKTTIPIKLKSYEWKGKTFITPLEALRLVSDTRANPEFDDYTIVLRNDFGASREDAERIASDFLGIKNKNRFNEI